MTRLRLAVFLAMFSLVFANGIAAAAKQQQEKSVKAIHKVEPVYPEEAERAKVEGKVILDVTVEQNGEVSMAKVINGHRLLNQAAIDAVKQWRFSNTFNEAVTIQLTIAFSLEAETAAPNEQKSTGDSALKNIHKVNPEYPDEAKRNRIQGEVRVEITVNDAGEVIDARAVSGDEILGQASVKAAKQFRFENGFHKTVVASLTFSFVLPGKK